MIPAGGLLDINVIPIEFETVVTRPKLEVVSHTRGRFEITREGGEFKAVKVDASDISRRGRIHAYNAAPKVQFKDGKLTTNTKNYGAMPSLANSFAKFGSSSATMPISKMAFEYTPEKISRNWIRDEKVLKGTPGRIDRYITQYPDVIIDYLGGPQYIPESSAPDYKDPELNVII